MGGLGVLERMPMDKGPACPDDKSSSKAPKPSPRQSRGTRSPSPEKTPIVAWDSEFNTAEDNYVPISDQLYCLHCEKGYFIPHINYQISVEGLFTQFFIEHPEITDIRLVCHYNKAEMMGLEEGSQILFEENSNFLAVQKGLFGEFKKTILGVERTFNLSDTNLLFPGPLEALGELIGPVHVE